MHDWSDLTEEALEKHFGHSSLGRVSDPIRVP